MCKKCGKKVHRVPEVLDSWIEAGSASFAERHFPFNPSTGSGQAEKLEDFFPPDFIAEYTGQIRAWFYVLHVIGAALYKSASFKNVGVEGVILGSDGRKMSKNLGNYPDPKGLLQKYGGDALRLYLMGSSVMNGEDLIISEEHYRNQVKGMMLVLWNIYNFLVSNAITDKFVIDKSRSAVSENVLDKWVLARLNGTVRAVTSSLEGYDTVRAIDSINQFISDLSLWYVRRSRDRVGLNAVGHEDKKRFYETLQNVLIELSKLVAPIAPFISEEIYKNLSEKESVHLEDWPKSSKDIDENINSEMDLTRKIVEMGHSERKKEGIKVRQPLGKIKYNLPIKLSEDLEKLILAELNIKEIEYKKGDMMVELDFIITPDLKKEGESRDIVRSIQEARKSLGTALDEKIDVVLPSWPKEFEDYIKKRALVDVLSKGDKFEIKRK